MFDKLIEASLHFRHVVFVLAIILVGYGTYVAYQSPIDVFPDLSAPAVTILTEAPGMAPAEVEGQITLPIEIAVNGAAGVRRVRSNSVTGFSSVIVEFDWGTDIYQARQIVGERLQALQISLPVGSGRPTMAPVTSIMGEIMLVGLTADSTSMMELRTIAYYDIRRRLLAIPGVAQISIYGGEIKQYQIQVSPYRLQAHAVTMDDISSAVADANENAAGGLMNYSGKEYTIRGLGRIRDVSDLEHVVVSGRTGNTVLLGEIANLEIGPAEKIGEASINADPAVVMVVTKDLGVNTLSLTREIENVLASMQPALPGDVVIQTDLFKQSDFIEVAIANVLRAARDGALLLVIILAIFLANVRTTVISVVAIPLSLLITVLVLHALGMTTNTMTLGGMAIAIGVLVDDAIIYVENIYRRVLLNSRIPEDYRQPYFTVVYDASREIRAPIVMANFVIIVVFLPLFFLSGVEGRLLAPLGIAYTVAILSSLFVAMTVTPAMSYFMLDGLDLTRSREGFVVRQLRNYYAVVLAWCLKRRAVVVVIAGLMLLAAVLLIPGLGRSFLPTFNEGTLNIGITTIPGTSLQESDQIGRRVEHAVLEHPAVRGTTRRTGRAEMDEHTMGSHAHELEVQTDLSVFGRDELMDDLRRRLERVPGIAVSIGQPISHRIDHMITGTRSHVAIKISGIDRRELQRLAFSVQRAIEGIAGVVDVSIDQQVDVPEIRVRANRAQMAVQEVTTGELQRHIETAFHGRTVSQVLEAEKAFDIVLRYAPEYRASPDDIGQSPIQTSTGAVTSLGNLSGIVIDRGPSVIRREDARRQIVVEANIAGREMRGAVDEIRERVSGAVTFPEGYFVEVGGQFEQERVATRTMLLFGSIAVLIIFGVLLLQFGSSKQALLVLLNLPLALIGGVVAIYFTTGIVSIAALVGFITLFGIAARNGVLLVSHYNYLMDHEGKSLDEAVRQGSMERVNPILMTALTAGFALLPLALAADRAGNEIQSPLAVVVLGGLVTATLLNLVVVPVLFSRFGR